MSVSIQVAIITRPFVPPNDGDGPVLLGIEHVQRSEKDGEVNLYHCDYSKNRFAFTWSWWTAYNFEKYLKDDTDLARANNMKLLGQKDKYDAMGQEIKGLVKEGNAIVVFAYGLSGSGKTFSVFGVSCESASHRRTQYSGCSRFLKPFRQQAHLSFSLYVPRPNPLPDTSPMLPVIPTRGSTRKTTLRRRPECGVSFHG